MKQLAALLALILATGTPGAAPADPAGDLLPGAEPLELEGDDIASELVAGVDRFLLRQTAESRGRRAARWSRDLGAHADYERSVEPQRLRLARLIGLRDARVTPPELEYVTRFDRGAVVGQGRGFEAVAVRWTVLDGVHGHGLLLWPPGREPLADVVALGDADQTPEALVGFDEGVAPASQFARRLAESGCRVLVPLLVDRGRDLSVTAAGERRTGLDHREFLYRPAFELGRHIIGYEVARVLAAVDWFAATGNDRPIGVFGYGEGGLLALHAAALDPRLAAAAVSGYFGPREELWREPIYRTVFGLLAEFGDAELATLVAPRPLVVECAAAPAVEHPPGGRGAPGRVPTPDPAAACGELDRAATLVAGLEPAPRFACVRSGDGRGPFGSEAALERFLDALDPAARLAPPGPAPQRSGAGAPLAPEARRRRNFDEVAAHTQRLLAESEYTRAGFWQDAQRAPDLEAFARSTERYRQYFAREVVGEFELSRKPPRPRARRAFEAGGVVGHEVVLDVYDDVIAYGLLLVPPGIAEGERRPVVVCQHGLEGRPRDVADPSHAHPAYNEYALRLAERGFVTFAPQNLYIFGDRFRTLQRKANPLQKTLFSVMVPQHAQIVEWLGTLPFVDPARIGFYGLSYGGKSAMRIPPLVPGYCLSICSADFNEWIWKNASLRSPYSYVSTGEYEIFEFDLGSTFNYAEMAALIAPRPFMVERGHRDGVAPDWRVASEYARVRLLYADLGIPERTSIEFFEGPHTIHGVGTFEFLHRHLDWPMEEEPRSLIRHGR